MNQLTSITRSIENAIKDFSNLHYKPEETLKDPTQLFAMAKSVIKPLHSLHAVLDIVRMYF